MFCCLDSKKNFVAIFRQYNRIDCPLLVNVMKKNLFDKTILVSNCPSPPPTRRPNSNSLVCLLLLSLICLKTNSPLTMRPYIGLENGSVLECPNSHQSHRFYTKIWFINGVDNVNWPPYEGLTLEMSAFQVEKLTFRALALRQNLFALTKG